MEIHQERTEGSKRKGVINCNEALALMLSYAFFKGQLGSIIDDPNLMDLMCNDRDVYERKIRSKNATTYTVNK